MLKIASVPAGTLELDGGAMFGVVPKRMWSKLNPPDANNMCTWAMRTMLVQTPDGRNVLIDTGIGNKQDEKFRSYFSPKGELQLFDSLKALGVSREDITDVFLTHLHFDHCGGAIWVHPETGVTEPAFPNAVYWTNEVHYQWAIHPNAREKASFLQENFVPLMEMGKLKMVPVEQEVSFLPGFKVRFYYGHTEALMAPVLDLGSKTVVYCADALPSQWHIAMPYVMAYDVRPLLTMEEKMALLSTAADKGEVLFLEHDPFVECATVHREAGGRIAPKSTGRLVDILAE
jgi:glyoxylase-like metal-dependent hydrolase (beta-lactamase superfamily II)